MPRSTPALIAFMRCTVASASWRGDLIDAAVALCFTALAVVAATGLLVGTFGGT